MLNVSNDWKSMFQKNLLNEALIKFDIENYGTLYKGDIYSYEFNGYVKYLCDEYPQYNATIKAVMRDDYANIENFIKKKVDVYYGYVINGVDEYHQALTMFIDDIEISDDGRIATFYLKSIFAYLTNTFSILLENQNGLQQTYSTFLSSQMPLNSYQNDGSDDRQIRTLPSKITLGEALQSLTFVNNASLCLSPSGTIIIKNSLSVAYNYKINILKHPHIAKLEKSDNVVVDWLDPSNPNYQIIKITDISANATIPQGNNQYYGLIGEIYFDSNSFASNSISNYEKTGGGGTLIGSYANIYNDKIDGGRVSSQDGAIYGYFNLYGYSANNFYDTSKDTTTIFDINIISQSHADDIKARVEDYFSTKKYVSLDLRINPAYELLDELYYDETMRRLIIEEMSISFNGAYKGTIKGRYNDAINAPIISNIGNTNTRYRFDIENTNYSDLVCRFEDEDGNSVDEAILILVNANTTLTYEHNKSIVDDLTQAFIDKFNGTLNRNIYAYFVVGGQRSPRTLLLEKDV